MALTVGADVAKPAASVGVVEGSVESFIVLEGKVDLVAEQARLAKAIDKAQKELAGVEKTLSNEGFIAKAAPAVVAKKRERAEELGSQIAAQRAQLADFS